MEEEMEMEGEMGEGMEMEEVGMEMEEAEM